MERRQSGAVDPKRARRPSHARHKARVYAMQAIYQWQLGGGGVGEVERQFLDNPLIKHDERPYFSELLNGVISRVEQLDRQLDPYMEQRKIEEVDPVERSILRLAAWELLFARQVAAGEVVREAVALTAKYGAEQGHRFVNAVIDRLARSCREGEQSAEQRKEQMQPV